MKKEQNRDETRRKGTKGIREEQTEKEKPTRRSFEE
jgi:hypothetical protein